MEGRHFLTFAPVHLHMKIETCFSSRLLGNFNQMLYVSFQVHGNENR